MRTVLLSIFCLTFLISPEPAQAGPSPAPIKPNTARPLSAAPKTASSFVVTERIPAKPHAQFTVRGNAIYLVGCGQTLRVTPANWLVSRSARAQEAHSPTLSPDGQMIAYIHEYRAKGYRHYALWRIPLDGRRVGNPVLLRDARHMPVLSNPSAMRLRWMGNRYLALRDNGQPFYFDAVGNALTGRPKVRVVQRRG